VLAKKKEPVEKEAEVADDEKTGGDVESGADTSTEEKSVPFE
jgi:hypothetical protein